MLSKYNTNLTMEFLLTPGVESQYFDRKSASISIAKLTETVIAFANADGGTIAIGIKDRAIEGIDAQGNVKINDFIQCGFEKCIPSVRYTPEFVDVIKNNGNSDRLLFLHIEASSDRVHRNSADEVFLRVGDESKKLSFEQRLSLEYDKGERLFEDNVIEDCRWEDLDEELLSEYKKAVNFQGDDLLQILYARGLAKRSADRPLITIAGVLLFAKYPSAYLPNARIRFIRYEGGKAEVGTSMNIIKQEYIEGPLVKQIETARSLVQSQLRTFTALNPLDGKFVSIPEYPAFAWQEGIVNAVTHRAYNIQGDDIKILLFDDRMEIVSPGKLPNIVTTSNIREVRYSRNPRIARVLTEFGWVKELGEGVKRIYEEMKSFFLDEPIYDEPNNQSVLLTLKNNVFMRRNRRQERIGTLVSSEWNSLPSHHKQALEIMYSRGKVTTKELAKIIERSTNVSRKVLEELAAKGFIRRVALNRNDPNQYYELIVE
ncbi:ATP-binding protein [Sporomusa sphaeroides]|uniref:Divergent AAA domain protein n=1 Tax=Sporomusa sphaeroides DSM 2875 TaxID=1337886 RepID=A0ABM9W3E1_9FIRM|nr:ATP-binding protein [Sporomusa sphaeroides]OLS56305.1 divergent AAA domain protein [Sporomusa sphaeroides DSM 2875]CVK18400.1 Divergent AAA domain protein [Sporomusa sphaeroides DSM 2875]